MLMSRWSFSTGALVGWGSRVKVAGWGSEGVQRVKVGGGQRMKARGWGSEGQGWRLEFKGSRLEGGVQRVKVGGWSSEGQGQTLEFKGESWRVGFGG